MNFNRVNPIDTPAYAADEARTDFFDAEFPAWDVREGYGERYLSEDDMPVWDEAANARELDIESHEAMAEMMWLDPAERHW